MKNTDDLPSRTRFVRSAGSAGSGGSGGLHSLHSLKSSSRARVAAVVVASRPRWAFGRAIPWAAQSVLGLAQRLPKDGHVSVEINVRESGHERPS
jgi:hypothetical protein